MKFKHLATLFCAAVLGSTAITGVSLINAGADTVPSFSTAETGVSVTTNAKGVATAVGMADSAFTLTYSEKVDFTSGASFQYLVPSSSDIDINSDRSSGANYVKVTAKDDSGYGIELKIYALWSKVATSHLNKMEVDVTYLDPTITEAKGNYIAVGRKYAESFTTYENVEDFYHTIDLHKESGYWFFAVDGLSAIPLTEYSGMVLDNCDVTLEVYSKAKTPTVKVKPVEIGVKKNFVIDGFMQFGSGIVTENGDDTTKIKVADKRAEEYPGTLIRYREQLISTVGYDVRQPINIEYSYDVSNASAVWYALGLGRGNVLSTIARRKYDVNATNAEMKTDYSDNIASKNDGIMIQTTTGMAQPTIAEQNHRLAEYKTNSKSKPYESRDDIDIVTFIVGETGTSMYMNGTLIFDNLATKLSDFADNNYIAYPYFHFFEDNANVEKGNTIVIKGVNAARRTDDKTLKVVGDSNADLQVGLTNNDNGDITLYHYVDGTLTALDGSLYTYDAENEILTVKYGYFSGKAYDVYKLYARNNSGSEEIVVRFSDPTLVTLPATTDKAEYTWLKGGTEDLVITVDVQNGTWKSFSGGGIMSSQYTYAAGENGSTVGTITIKATYLNTKSVGNSYTYTIKTTNVEEEEFTCKFTIKITDGTETEGGDNDGAKEEPKSGCGASIVGIGAAVLALGAAAVVLTKKKEN